MSSDAMAGSVASDGLASEREQRVHWVLKGGGRWGLHLAEVAWSVRLDQRGRELFPAGEAMSLVRSACSGLLGRGEIETNGTNYRLASWTAEPW
jgi:hypothetical protein